MSNERINAALREIASALGNTDEEPNPALLHHAIAPLMRACGDDPIAALMVACKQLALTENQRNQLVAAFKALKKQLGERPSLAWVLSRPFMYGTNGEASRRIFVSRIGRELYGMECVSVPDDITDPKQAPNPLDLCLISGDGSTYLGKAPVTPPLQADEYMVQRVNESTFDGISEIVVNEGPEQRRMVLFAPPDLAKTVADKLADGDLVSVQAWGRVAARIVKDGVAQHLEDWLEIYPTPEGPKLEDMVFPEWLHALWRHDVRWIVNNRGFRVALIGPTGVGKSEAVLRAGRAAAMLTKKPLALIRLSGPQVCSSFYGETERNILAAVKKAKKLSKQYVVVILLDEADALLGDSNGRYEGSVDRRVRLAFQQLLSDDVGVPVYATMNPRADSWLPAPIERRFIRREYPRSCRRQIAEVSARYADEEALKKVGMPPATFGGRVADFLFNDRFVIARAILQSGAALEVRARDLHGCSPGKVKDLVVSFCTDVNDGEPADFQVLLSNIQREFQAGTLNETNLFEMTFLKRPAHDNVKVIERVEPGTRANYVTFQRPNTFQTVN